MSKLGQWRGLHNVVHYVWITINHSSICSHYLPFVYIGCIASSERSVTACTHISMMK